MQADPTLLKDGFVGLLRGVDSSRSPELLDEGYAAFSTNVAYRGGKPRTRLQFHQIDLTGDSLLAFEQQLLQGAGVYFRATEGDSDIILAIGGRIVRVQLDNFNGVVADLNAFTRNIPTARTYICQGENYLIIQNGVNTPLIYDGTTLRRARSGADNSELLVSDITLVGTTATVTTTSPVHPYIVGDYIDLFGAAMGIYTGQHYVIAVTAPNQFDIDVTGAFPSIPSGDLKVRYCPEMPTGTITAYGQGRFFVANPARNEFIAMDIIFGDERGEVRNILRNTENTYLAEGGAFRLPVFMGRITAMYFVPFQDTATGQGDLIVFGERGAASFDVSKPRSTWKATPIQRVLFATFGCTSQESVVGFNGDLIFRSADGVRSYRMARAEASSYGQTPISAEVDRVLELDEPQWLTRATMTEFDRRLFISAAPMQSTFQNRITSVIVNSLADVRITTTVPHAVSAGSLVKLTGTAYVDGTYTVVARIGEYEFSIAIPAAVPSENLANDAYLEFSPEGVSFDHRAIVPLDFTPTSVNSSKGPAAYNGVWTGTDESFRLLLSGMFDQEMRGFFVGRNAADGNTLWEIMRTYGDDIDRNDNARPIQCWLETRAFDFQRTFELKKLLRADIWLSGLSGNVAFKVYFRPDQYPGWVLWHEFTQVAPYNDTTIDPVSGQIIGGLPQYKTQVTLPTPPDSGSAVDNRLFRVGFTFQIRIEWVGNCTIEKFLVYANQIPENLQNGGM